MSAYCTRHTAPDGRVFDVSSIATDTGDEPHTWPKETLVFDVVTGDAVASFFDHFEAVSAVLEGKVTR